MVLTLTLSVMTGYTPKRSQLRGRGTVVRVVPDEGFVADARFGILRAERAGMKADPGLVGYLQ